MIYFVQGLDGGAVKIGFTDDMATRLPQLEYKYKQPLAVLATMPGNREREQEIHARFSHLRFGKTEQFRPAADLMAFIGRPLLVGANPDAVEAMDDHSKPMIVQVRGSHEFKAWAEELARFDGLSLTSLFDRSIRLYAKAVGFNEPPPKR